MKLLLLPLLPPLLLHATDRHPLTVLRSRP